MRRNPVSKKKLLILAIKEQTSCIKSLYVTAPSTGAFCFRVYIKYILAKVF